MTDERLDEEREIEALLASDESVYIEEEAFEPEAVPPPPPPFPDAAASGVRERAWEALARRFKPGAAGPARKPKRARAGLPGLLELVAVVGSLVALNVLVFPLDPGFRRAEFNPFFLPGILLGLRYGTLTGLAAGAASALWVAGPWRGGVGEAGWIAPGLMAALGLLAGSLARGQGGRLAFYRTWSRRLEAQRAALRATLDAQDAVIRDLQAKIEESAVSLRRLYRISRGMASGDRNALSRSLLEILARDLRARRASVWIADGSGLRALATLDVRTAPEPFPERMPATEGLPGLALRLDRPVSCADPEAAGLRGAGVLAGVVGGASPAMVVWVEDLPVVEFGPAVEARFRALLEWAAESRSRARGSVFDAEIGAYRSEHLAEAVDREIGRARRHGTPLRLAFVRLLGYGELPEDRRRAARIGLARSLVLRTRDTDLVCQTEEEDTFAVVMPMCGADAGTALFARLSAAAKRAPAPAARFSFSEACMNGHPVDALSLMEEARRGLNR